MMTLRNTMIGLAVIVALIQGSSGRYVSCQLCDTKNGDWIKNKTMAASWLPTNETTAEEQADAICLSAMDLYYECYAVCDMARAAPSSELRANSVKRFLDVHCLESECRLADAMICHYDPPKLRCDAELANCKRERLENQGCDTNRMCTEGERRAYVEHMDDRMDCFLGGYPDNVAVGVIPTLSQGQGLQQCRDIIRNVCLKTWHEGSTDFNFVSTLNDTHKAAVCGGREEALKCLSDVTNGTVNYANYDYEAPCNLTLLRNPGHVDLTLQEVMVVYDRICSGEQLCLVENVNDTTEPFIDIGVVPDPTEPTPIIEDEVTPPAEVTPMDHTEMDHSDMDHSDKEHSDADTEAPRTVVVAGDNKDGNHITDNHKTGSSTDHNAADLPHRKLALVSASLIMCLLV